MRDFESFYEQATGHRPYGYQVRIARDGLPDAVRAPTGTGKTGVILAWLWRRLSGPDPAGTPRRLVYALPQRAVLDEVASLIRAWLANLELTDEVALHVTLGDRGSSTGEWRENLHRPAIVVGTVETNVTKALNRAYGFGPAIYPIEFGLATNGAQWIIDEAQLCPAAVMTLRQLAGWGGRWGTAEPFGLTCSPVYDDGRGRTAAAAGNLSVGETIEIAPQERAGELAAPARRVAHPAGGWVPGDYAALAEAVRGLHGAGTMTLVVLNSGSRRARGVPEAAGRIGRMYVVAPPASRRRASGATGGCRGVPFGPNRGNDRRSSVQPRSVGVGARNRGRALGVDGATGGAVQPHGHGAGCRGLVGAPGFAPSGCARTRSTPRAPSFPGSKAAAVTGEELAARGALRGGGSGSRRRLAEFAALFDTSPLFPTLPALLFPALPACRSDSDVDVARYVRDAEDLDASGVGDVDSWRGRRAGPGGALPRP